LLEELTRKFSSLKGGSLSRILDNLVSCSFIKKTPPLYNEAKGTIYRLIDEFVLFHLKWIKSAKYFHQLQPSVVKLDDLFQNYQV